MKRALNSLAFLAAFLCSTVSGSFAGGGPPNLFSGINDPSKTAGLKALVSSDIAAVQALSAEVSQPEKDAGYRCAAIEILGASKDRAAVAAIALAVRDPEAKVRECASRVAGETKNSLAVEQLLATLDNYERSAYGNDKQINSGPYENNLSAQLNAIRAVWALGEIGDARVMDRLEKLYASADDVIKINLLASMGKFKGNTQAGLYVRKIAAAASETAAVRSPTFYVFMRNSCHEKIPVFCANVEFALQLSIGLRPIMRSLLANCLTSNRFLEKSRNNLFQRLKIAAGN